MPFTFHHGELRFSHNVFVFSEWTQCIRFLVNFITLHWTTLLVRLQLHSSSIPKQFCECMFFSCWRCVRMTHRQPSYKKLQTMIRAIKPQFQLPKYIAWTITFTERRPISFLKMGRKTCQQIRGAVKHSKKLGFKSLLIIWMKVKLKDLS
jgi:hypothetical protein